VKRYLNDSTIIDFVSSKLWQQKINEDCKQQNVFFTIREDRIDLYHKGGKLFSFKNNSLKTHIKYAAVIDSNDDSDQNYLSESELQNLSITSDYLTGYKRIKENCSKYSGVESAGVSQIYHKHSYLSDSDVVVLDIEISFDALDESSKKDRIDLLLLDRNTGKLQFVEAKHFSNKELWSKSNPSVIKQLARYEKQISDRESEIIIEYGKYVQNINSIFKLDLPVPTEIENQVLLLVFGFDDDQKKGRLNKLINKNEYYRGVKTYQKGDIKNLNTTTLWNGKVLK